MLHKVKYSSEHSWRDIQSTTCCV